LSTLLQFVITLNALFFLLYGLQCFTSNKMVLEFERFGLPDSRRILTGVLQLLGSAGLLVGFLMPVIGFLASGGLAIMMLVAFAVRIKIRDGFLESAPSFVFLLLNGWVSMSFYALI